TVKYPRRSYPFKPPKVYFKTSIWHPNVCPRTGLVWIDALGDGWTVALTLRTILISVRALLSTPETRNWINHGAARQHVRQREAYEATAKFWAQYFANVPRETQDRDMCKKVLDLEKMGANRKDTILALSNAGWDVEQATEMLFL
ncbi:ubiquitin-conjugating enzyme E2 K, partial [Aphelenchoides avenae]